MLDESDTDLEIAASAILSLKTMRYDFDHFQVLTTVFNFYRMPYISYISVPFPAEAKPVVPVVKERKKKAYPAAMPKSKFKVPFEMSAPQKYHLIPNTDIRYNYPKIMLGSLCKDSEETFRAKMREIVAEDCLYISEFDRQSTKRAPLDISLNYCIHINRELRSPESFWSESPRVCGSRTYHEFLPFGSLSVGAFVCDLISLLLFPPYILTISLICLSRHQMLFSRL